MAELFGFKIQRSAKDSGGETTFSTPTPDDGTIDVAGGGFFGQVLEGIVILLSKQNVILQLKILSMRVLLQTKTM